MKAEDTRALTTGEVSRKLDDTYQELMNLRMQVSIGQQKNTTRLTQLRRDVARLKTVLRERELTQFASAVQEG